jgi:anti-sigma factor RsiW
VKPSGLASIFMARKCAAEDRMFTCKESISLLLNFLDGDIPPDEEKHLEEHLSGCPPCVDFFKTYRATPSLCRRALKQEMPKEMASKLGEFLRSRIKK